MTPLLRLIPGYDAIATREDAWFEETIAQRYLDFFPECLHHIEGAKAGQPFILEKHQQAVIANIFGWQRVDALGRTVRRYREVLIYEPRKNGKSPIVAGLGMAVLFCDNEIGQQNYVAAGEREQAGNLFRYCKGMVENDPDLKRRCKIYGGNAAAGQSKSIVIEQDYSFLRVISSDAETKHGGNTHLGIIDELHVQPDRNLVDVLRTSTASANRQQPLLIYITTADFDRPSICNELYDYACQVRDGRANTAFLPVIYEAPRLYKGMELDYTDPAVYQDEKLWAIANPNLGVSVSLDYLRAEAQRAQAIPAYLPTFLRLHLNVRTKQAALWLDMARWDASAGHEAPDDLLGRTCWGGLDLGATSDLTSLCLVFPNDDGSYAARWWNWAPADTAKKRAQKGDNVYLDALARGELLTTEGNETDYGVIRAALNAIADDYGIMELAVDRKFQGAQLSQELLADGFQVVTFGQGFQSMAAPTDELGRLVNRGEFHHGGNRLVRWAAGNVYVQQGPAGTVKPDKQKSSDKIDPIVAAIMALGRAMARPIDMASTLYDTAGPLIL
jgi:phage terminase large subunit-like protein